MVKDFRLLRYSAGLSSLTRMGIAKILSRFLELLLECIIKICNYVKFQTPSSFDFNHFILLQDSSFSALRFKIMSSAEIALFSGSNLTAFSICSTARLVSPIRISAMELQWWAFA